MTARLTASCFGVAGLLFVLYQVIRPYSDESSLQGAAAFGSDAWVVAHSLAIFGFILLVLGLLGVYTLVRGTPAERLALLALVTTWIGVGLTLPFYGAEVFGLHAIGQEALRLRSAQLVSLAAEVRGQPGLSFIITGLVVLGVGILLLALALWRSRLFLGWIGVPLAASFALFLPQFFATQPVRVVHGLLVAAGCGLIAWNALVLHRYS